MKNYKAFRRRKAWEVKNQALYSAMVAKGVRPSDLAELTEVDLRSVQRWIFEGGTPNRERQAKIGEILEKSVPDLFGTHKE